MLLIILLTLICSLYHVKEIVSFWVKYTAYVVYTLWARLREHIVTIFIMHCSVILQLVLDFWYFYLRLFWIWVISYYKYHKYIFSNTCFKTNQYALKMSFSCALFYFSSGKIFKTCCFSTALLVLKKSSCI